MSEKAESARRWESIIAQVQSVDKKSGRNLIKKQMPKLRSGEIREKKIYKIKKMNKKKKEE